ncbi:MAG: WYL domain-containing protein [Clostridiales bacterium]|nr:WYL domain-containing protein [Clostridiales bacterium]
MMKERMLVLLDILHELTDEEHIMNSQSLLTELFKRGYTTDRRSVYRDVEALASYGFDVVTTSKGFYLRNRKFSLAEIMLLISAVQAAPFVTESKTDSLMTKLLGFLSVYQREGIKNASNIGGVKFGNEEVYRTIEMINYGIASRKTISFLYYKRSIMRRDVVQRRGKRYVVSPYAMVWVQDRYYLISNMKGKEGLTHFRLDRIRDVRIEDAPIRPVNEVSEYEKTFDAVDYASKCLNMFGGEISRIRLRCHMDLLNELFDRFGEDIPVKKDGEEHFIALVEAAKSEGFVNWVCQYGSKAEVLEPADLRESVKQRLTEAAKLYDE